MVFINTETLVLLVLFALQVSLIQTIERVVVVVMMKHSSSSLGCESAPFPHFTQLSLQLGHQPSFRQKQGREGGREIS